MAFSAEIPSCWVLILLQASLTDCGQGISKTLYTNDQIFTADAKNPSADAILVEGFDTHIHTIDSNLFCRPAFRK